MGSLLDGSGSQGIWPPPSVLISGALVNLVMSTAAFLLGTVSVSGAIMGMLLGVTTYWAAGWQGFALMLAFFVVGTSATKIGYARKLGAGIAQERGGARGWQHALANVGGPALMALLAWLTPFRELFLISLSGALATATGDTVSSEIGKAYGKRTFLITTLRPVPAGTTGAVSAEGTLAGVLACFGVALLARALGVVSPAWWMLVGLAGSLGFFLEGYVGALFESSGWLNNEQVNFINTLLGAGLAAAFVWALGGF